jgi:aspartyl-tRNA(Asn)/glutamyl-tRNA(Gln) amidotransferase subunit A
MTKETAPMSPSDNDDLCLIPITRLSAMISGGELRSSDLVAACLDRIRAADPKLHAFVDVYETEAKAVAEARDREADVGHMIGPLHGVPVALKDLCEIEGRVTRCGSLMWRDRISPTTATIVQRLRAAGAIVIGKTHMVEFAFGGWGTNAAMGTPWNPWDLDLQRVPGGSSSGSAVAVASGMVPAAIGSDTGGSVRIPASMCGLVGLKTTVGRISNHGILPLSDTLDTIGPLTRSVADAALMFAVLSGIQQTTGPAFASDSPTEIGTGVAGMRLAVLAGTDRDGIDREVLAAYDEACRTLESLGAVLVEVRLPDSFPSYLEQTGLIIAAEGHAVHQEWIEDDTIPFDPNVRARILAGKSIGAAEYLRALDRRRQMQAQIGTILADFAALLTPTTPIPAIPVSEVEETAMPLSRFTRAVNYLDRCALSVPCGFSNGGLPLSLQIIGHGNDEARVLRIGQAYESACGWLDRTPDLASHVAA